MQKTFVTEFAEAELERKSTVNANLLKGIWHPSAHVWQFDFLSNGTVFKVDICDKNLHRPYEACENSNTDIEGLFSHLWKI